MDDKALALACREIAAHFEGDVAVTAFEYYDAINTHFFHGVLPQAFIITGITPYGKCIGLTKHYFKQPIILLHQGMKTEQERFYVLLHEAIHVHVRYCLGYTGKKSHDSVEWLGEVNRIAPMIGYEGIVLAADKVKRRPKSEGGKLARVQIGSLPYECSYTFPHALPKHTQKPLPPIEQWL